ncbi:MAG: PfkB family carbohydrate kinase [Spirochaetota bacterium]|nr:PfkB family carbohydrate kinase [Spirochaetota bacterium]
MEDILGGTALHFSNSASVLSEINIVGVVGNDFPKEGFEFFHAKNVDVEGIQVIDGGKTFRWKGYYEKDMAQAITLDTQLNVFETFQPKVPEKYRQSDFLFLGNIDPELQHSVLTQVNGCKAVVLDTMNFWIDSRRDALMKVIKQVDVIVLNDQEIRDLMGEDNIIKAGNALLNMGPKFVVVKKGEHGAALFGPEGEYFTLPAYPIVELFDPTGAGDTFAGGLVSYLDMKGKLSFENLKRALCYAIVVSSFQVEHFGVKGLEAVTYKDIKERYKQYAKYAQLPDI